MKKPGLWSVACMIVGAVLFMSAAGCADRGDTPPVAAPPAPGGLTAAPPSVSVGLGQAVSVVISGGTPPYEILVRPDTGLVSTALPDPSTEPDTLVITGVTVASVAGSTSVRVADSSPSPRKEVTVQITKLP